MKTQTFSYKLAGNSLFSLYKIQSIHVLKFVLFSFLIFIYISNLQSQENFGTQVIKVNLKNGRSVGPCEYTYEPNNTIDHSNKNFYYCTENPGIYGVKPMSPISLRNIKEINNIIQAKDSRGTPISYYSSEIILIDDSKFIGYIWGTDSFTLKCKNLPEPEKFLLLNVKSIKFEYVQK